LLLSTTTSRSHAESAHTLSVWMGANETTRSGARSMVRCLLRSSVTWSGYVLADAYDSSWAPTMAGRVSNMVPPRANSLQVGTRTSGWRPLPLRDSAGFSPASPTWTQSLYGRSYRKSNVVAHGESEQLVIPLNRDAADQRGRPSGATTT